MAVEVLSMEENPATDRAHGSSSRAVSIPRRVLLVSGLILLLVGGVVFYAVRAVHTLGESTQTLLRVGLPLQEQLLRMEDTQRQAEFFLGIASVLPHAGYEKAFQAMVNQEQAEVISLQQRTAHHPELGAALTALQQNLAAYASAAATDPLLQQQRKTAVQASFQTVRTAVSGLLIRQGQQAARARDQAIDLLYGLIFATACLGIFIPWRVAAALTRPLKAFRRALEEIGAGRLTTVAAEGPAELRELARGIENMQARLQEEERLRHEFLSQVSHELKTPLASARSGSELLLSERLGPLQPRQREVLEIIARQVQELYAAIQEMLDMHALQARTLDFAPQEVPVPATLAELCQRLLPLTQKKGQDLQCHSAEGLSVFADPQRLRQILSNLVSNAHKYSPAGGKIRVNAEARDQGVEFRVEDDGPGIPPALLERVFDRFFQVPVGSGLPRGTGLGLAITRELVTAQGGWIKLGNRPEGGLCAEIWLPSPTAAGTP
ncbi:MAG: HAMP domain-containing histidine kinase [Gammaproteobacteria bacterium]|nr:HAMP domain-containing histidine kinase [Gammaproteobacteria bacterium]